MDCSGTQDCGCDKCYDDSSSDDDSCSSSSSRRPKILNQLPRGAIPVNHFNSRNNYIAPQPINMSPCSRPITMTMPIFPLQNLVGLDSGYEGKISISILHNQGAVMFTWETFRGQLGAKGITSVVLSGSLPYQPIYPISIPIRLEYNGIGQIGYLIIDPKEAADKVKFHFSVTHQKSTQNGDIVYIYGNTASFITNDY